MKILNNFGFLILSKSKTLLVNVLVIINSLYIFLNTHVLDVYFLDGIILLESESILKCAEVFVEFILLHAVHHKFVKLVSKHFIWLHITVYCLIYKFIFWKPVFSKIYIQLIIVVKVIRNALLRCPIVLNKAIIVLNSKLFDRFFLIFIL